MFTYGCFTGSPFALVMTGEFSDSHARADRYMSNDVAIRWRFGMSFGPMAFWSFRYFTTSLINFRATSFLIQSGGANFTFFIFSI